MTAPEPETLLFETSPFGTLDAIVQADDRTVFFYLSGPPAWGSRACWVANLIPGPLEFNPDDLRGDAPPLLPRIHCVDPNPSPRPAADELRIVWFEEGNAAALLWNGRLAAVIPPWSGSDGFHGYAANCASENLVCWPLPPGRELQQRVDRAVAFWDMWRTDPPFRSYQSAWLAHCAEQLGAQSGYWSTDGGKFPPRGIAAFERDDRSIVLVTVGLALVPQPTPLADEPPPNWFPNIELALQLGPEHADQAILDRLVPRLAILGAIPWRTFAWLGAGHHCELLREPGPVGRAVLRTDPPPGVPSLTPPAAAGTLTPRLLWLHPL